MSRLPIADGKKHIKAFKKLGWQLDRIKGSHYILAKKGCEAILSIPVHGSKPLDTGLLKGLLRDAEINVEEYLRAFYGRKYIK